MATMKKKNSNRGKPNMGINAREALWRDFVANAQAGDIEYVRIVADRVFPKLKPIDHPKQFELSGDTPTAKANSILTAVSDGQLSIDEGTKLIGAIASVMKVIEVDDLQQRIEALEGMK